MAKRPSKARGKGTANHRPLFDVSEDSLRGAQARQAFQHRIASAARARLRSQARPYTDAQWHRLATELGVTYPPYILRYVEFANGLSSGQGTLRQPEWFEKPTEKVWLSRVFFIEAINLAINGTNSYFTEAELMAESFGQTPSEYLAAEMDELEQLALFPMPSPG